MEGLMFPKEKTKKKRKSHPPSILGSRKGKCYLCGRYTKTEEHLRRLWTESGFMSGMP